MSASTTISSLAYLKRPHTLKPQTHTISQNKHLVIARTSFIPLHLHLPSHVLSSFFIELSPLPLFFLKQLSFPALIRHARTLTLNNPPFLPPLLEPRAVIPAALNSTCPPSQLHNQTCSLDYNKVVPTTLPSFLSSPSINPLLCNKPLHPQEPN